MGTSIPPRRNAPTGVKNPEEAKAWARHEVKCTLEDVIREGTKVLRPGGRFYMVRGPGRLMELFRPVRAHGLEPRRMKRVHPYGDGEENRVLREAGRGGGPLLKGKPPVIVFDEEGGYSEEIRTTYGY